MLAYKELSDCCLRMSSTKKLISKNRTETSTANIDRPSLRFPVGSVDQSFVTSERITIFRNNDGEGRDTEMSNYSNYNTGGLENLVSWAAVSLLFVLYTTVRVIFIFIWNSETKLDIQIRRYASLLLNCTHEHQLLFQTKGSIGRKHSQKKRKSASGRRPRANVVIVHLEKMLKDFFF